MKSTDYISDVVQNLLKKFGIEIKRRVCFIFQAKKFLFVETFWCHGLTEQFQYFWAFGCSVVVCIFFTFSPWIWQMNFETDKSLTVQGNFGKIIDADRNELSFFSI
jgi:hypothetical protein